MAPEALSAIDQARDQWTALPPLKLMGAGTSLVESLPSFVSRLLATTGVTAVHLADGLGVGLSGELMRVGAFLKVKDPAQAERTISKLERLTGARNLRSGTFWALASILTAANQDNRKKSRRRWCPICYGEWGAESYEPLAWAVDLLRACPKHGCLLNDSCPSCGRPQRHRLSETRRRFCHACRADLSTSVTRVKLHPFLQWVDKQVLDLVEFCATPRSDPVAHDVLREFVRGLHRTMGGRRGGALGQLMKLYDAGARLRQQRTSMRTLINLCAVQGISVGEFLAAPRETSGPLLFDTWGGLDYLPLPSPRQAQKIYVASRCLKEFLRLRPPYLPSLHMLLGGFKVQLLAIRDVAEEAYDTYVMAYSIQGDSSTQHALRAAYVSAMDSLFLRARGSSLDDLALGVARNAKVGIATAKRVALAANAVLKTQAAAVIARYEEEMPPTSSVDWFIQNRTCSWNGTSNANG